MKQLQLLNPDLQYWVGPHDLLLLDEAQDMNPCMLSVCLQQSVPKIVVGDQHQQIYSFRGAVNALELVVASDQTTVRTNYTELQVWIRDSIHSQHLPAGADEVRRT